MKDQQSMRSKPKVTSQTEPSKTTNETTKQRRRVLVEPHSTQE